MTIGELKEFIKFHSLPDDTKIFLAGGEDYLSYPFYQLSHYDVDENMCYVPSTEANGNPMAIVLDDGR